MNLRDAAALVGRSVDTLRRWRGQHGLRDYRDPSDPTSPSVVSRGELLTLLSRLQAAHPVAPGVIDGVLVPPGGTGLQGRPTVQALSPLLHELVGDLRSDRDRLLTERDRALEALEAERRRANDARDRLLAVQTEALEHSTRLARLEALVLSGKAKALDAERRRLLARDQAQASSSRGSVGRGYSWGCAGVSR